MPEPKIDVPEAIPLMGVEAVVAFDAAAVAGRISDPGSSDPAHHQIEAKVVLIPQPGQSGFLKSRSTLAAPDGSYRLAGIAPGEYMLYAVPPGVTAELTDPVLQSTLERFGRPLRLQPEDTVTVDLPLAPREAVRW